MSAFRQLHSHFYPRSPCGERLRAVTYDCPSITISIHALLAESDWCISRSTPVQAAFLSTLSLRRATQGVDVHQIAAVFLSTLSLRRATARRRARMSRILISIHALLAESDQLRPNCTAGHQDFYPRSPCGERRSNIPLSTNVNHFYPRSPCGERRACWHRCAPQIPISIHALLAESDSKSAQNSGALLRI